MRCKSRVTPAVSQQVSRRYLYLTMEADVAGNDGQYVIDVSELPSAVT